MNNLDLSVAEYVKEGKRVMFFEIGSIEVLANTKLFLLKYVVPEKQMLNDLFINHNYDQDLTKYIFGQNEAFR